MKPRRPYPSGVLIRKPESGIERLIIFENEKREAWLILHHYLKGLGSFPVTKDERIDGILDRAKKIISHLPRRRWEYLVMWAEYIVQQDLTTTSLDPKRYVRTGPNLNPMPSLLADRLDAYPLKDSPDFRDSNWSEIFSAVAVAFVGRTLDARKRGAYEKAVFYLISASEAIGNAESHLRQGQTESDRRRTTGRRGGHAKDERENARWRRLAAEFGRTCKQKSFHAAALRFLYKYGHLMIEELGREFTERTIAQWIAADPAARERIERNGAGK